MSTRKSKQSAASKKQAIKKQKKNTPDNNDDDDSDSNNNSSMSEVMEKRNGLGTKFGTLVDKLVENVDEKIKILEEKERRWDALHSKIVANIDAASRKIVLDIGGTRFSTTKSTLLTQEGSFFEAMLGSGLWKPEADGSYFIDRNPKHFSIILDFLRMGTVNQEISTSAMTEIQAELDFYQIRLTPFARSELLNEAHKQEILKWIGGQVTITTLLYSATRDGFGSNHFHNKCDSKGPTVVVIKSTAGHMFGGYASKPWASIDEYQKAVGCFIFTLSNPHNIPPTKYEYVDEAHYANGMCNSCMKGPTFGGGHDLCVYSNSNKNNKSYTKFHTYKDTTGQGPNTFTGDLNFQTTEIEVFLVQ